MRSALALLLLVQTAPALAGEPPKGLTTQVAEGSVGPYLAGLNLTLRDYAAVVAAHYYYASTGTNIPLTVGPQGSSIVFDEPDGGHFDLHLTNGDATEPRPLTFYTSTGLAGTWTHAGQVLPVTFGFSTGFQGLSPTRWYGDVTADSDAAFEARVRTFLKAVTSGNRAMAAGVVAYPLTVNGAHRTIIRTRAQLLARWSTLFTPATVGALRKAIPHEMFVRDGMAMVASGTVWFNANGAKVLNLP
ncbi:MAG: hypothetical protein RIS94_2631 [Pseudomonadota bacterium]|jgi:hypothetical protein